MKGNIRKLIHSGCKYKGCICLVFLWWSLSVTGFCDNLERVVVNLGWKHQFEFAGFHAAKEMGFYREEGLDVVIREGEGFYPYPKDDEADYFVVNANRFLADSGRDSYVVVAPIFQQSPLALLVKTKNDITSLKELYGKKLAVGTEIRAMLSAAGLDFSKIKLEKGLTGLHNLESYDGITYYINDVYLDGNDKKRYKLFRPIEYGINFYGECLVTSRTEVDKRPDRVEKFRRATLKGWRYAMEHPDEVASIIYEKYKSKRSLAELKREAEVVRNQLVLPELYEIGSNDKRKWVHMNNILIEQGIVKEKLNVDQIIYEPSRGMSESVTMFIQVISLTLLVAIGLLVMVNLHNIRLRKRVRERTKELSLANTKLEGLNTFKDRIIAMISHDTKGPLGRLSSILHLYKGGDISTIELDSFLNRIGSDTEMVGLLLDNLLSWTGRLLDKGKLEVVIELINIRELLNEVLQLYSTNILDKGIKIEIVLGEEQIMGDVHIIRLIFRNLIANALKFSPISGTVTISNQKDRQGQIMFTVQDEGKGLDNETLNSLFSSSVKSVEGTAKEKGHGIGLYLCKELIVLHGGKIWAENWEGNGCCFHFLIPVLQEISANQS